MQPAGVGRQEGRERVTLGRTLREARQKKKVSESQAAAATRIKIQTIQDLENEEFSRIAAPIYGKGFIRMYAEYLGLDPDPLIDDYVAQVDGGTPPSLCSDIGSTVDGERETEKDGRRSRIDWQALSPFRGIRILGLGRRIRAAFSEDPWKVLSIGIGILFILVFAVSALSRYGGPRRRTPVSGKLEKDNASRFIVEPPDAYYDGAP
ncbi:MAG: hypothetical protein E4H02_05885 [Lentisphaerales bacterium]|jgi:transcriptional regulator with XRE-family HTH domain|nr:MAG: hypothetical protein E4H02_05885 [Lentisphaerales bacterium]